MDQGHKLTEKELAALESRIAKVYQASAKDLQKKVDQYFASFVQRDKKQLELLKAGKITEEQYRQWRLSQIGRGKRFEALRDQVAERMTEANKVALSYVNDTTPGIYSLNHNYAAYTIEQVSGDVGFTIWDEQTVKQLMAEDPTLLPKRRVNAPKDLKWNKRQFTAEITAGIIQGEAIGKIANRVQNLSDANRSGAIRNARTAVTGAQNAGRQASYSQAKEMGLQLRKRWIATKDNRTRHAHAMLDGQTVDMDKPFEIEGQKLMFPGDPTGLARLVWNCRCTMRTVEKEGIEAEPRKMRVSDFSTGRNSLANKMTYAEWLNWKNSLENVSESGIIRTDDIKPIKITKQIIDRVPTVHFPGVSTKVSTALQSQYKELLETAMSEPDGVEVGFVCDMNGKRTICVTGKSKNSVKIPSVSYDHIALHNHPDGFTFSETDILQFIFRGNMKGLVAVGNNGNVYAVAKTEDYDGMAAYMEFKNAQDRLTQHVDSGDVSGYIREIKAFLNGGKAYGIEYVERNAGDA